MEKYLKRLIYFNVFCVYLPHEVIVTSFRQQTFLTSSGAKQQKAPAAFSTSGTQDLSPSISACNKTLVYFFFKYTCTLASTAYFLCSNSHYTFWAQQFSWLSHDFFFLALHSGSSCETACQPRSNNPRSASDSLYSRPVGQPVACMPLTNRVLKFASSFFFKCVFIKKKQPKEEKNEEISERWRILFIPFIIVNSSTKRSNMEKSEQKRLSALSCQSRGLDVHMSTARKVSVTFMNGCSWKLGMRMIKLFLRCLQVVLWDAQWVVVVVHFWSTEPTSKEKESMRLIQHTSLAYCCLLLIEEQREESDLCLSQLFDAVLSENGGEGGRFYCCRWWLHSAGTSPGQGNGRHKV